MLDAADVLAIMIGVGILAVSSLAIVGYCANQPDELGEQL